MSGPSRLQSIRGVNWRRVLIQADFISGQIIGRWLTVTVTLIVVLHVVVLLILGPTQAAAELMPLLFMTSVIYALIAGQVVSQMADEIGEGHAMLYLIHPLRKVEYLYAWLVAGPMLILAGYIASLIVPLLVVDPSILAEAQLYRLITVMAGQLLYHISLATLFSVIAGRRGRATSMYLGMLIFVPLALTLAMIIIMAVLDIYIGEDTAFTVLGVVYPALRYLADQNFATYLLSTIYEYGASLTLLALSLGIFTHRKEL